MARIDFRAEPPDAALPPARERALDLRFGTDEAAECVRLPFSASRDEATWRPSSEWFAAVAARLTLLEPASTPIRGAVVGGQVGRWLGPGRLRLEPGGAAAPRPAFSPGAHGELVLLQHGIYVLGASGGYTVSTASQDFCGTDLRLLHGPQAALRLKLAPPPTLDGAGFPGGPQLGAFEVIVPVGFWFGAGTDSRFLGPTLGRGVALTL